jgi:hypothetical protein
MRTATSTIMLAVVALSGCASFSTHQTDITTTAADGTETRSITTRATGRTFAASKQTLATWKATQTDKSQGASVGGLNQESDASSLTKALGEGVAAALVKGIKP